MVETVNLFLGSIKVAGVFSFRYSITLLVSFFSAAAYKSGLYILGSICSTSLKYFRYSNNFKKSKKIFKNEYLFCQPLFFIFFFHPNLLIQYFNFVFYFNTFLFPTYFSQLKNKLFYLFNKKITALK